MVYSLKVTSRNSVGSSLQSEAISIRAAKKPNAPILLANVPSVTTGYQIGLAWTEGIYNGGSPVLSYQISFKQESATQYTIFESG